MISCHPYSKILAYDDYGLYSFISNFFKDSKNNINFEWKYPEKRSLNYEH